jgi:hypothetical protein
LRLCAFAFNSPLLRLCVKILLIIALIVGIDRFCHEQTGTFCLHKIIENRPEDPTWEAPPLSEAENKQIEALLEQPFTFLGHGNECFVFLSHDGSTVLKCFKLQFLRPAYLKEMVQAPLSSWKETLVQARITRLKRTFDSLKIAYETLKKETALLYVHLTPSTHFKKPLVLIDKLGIKHTLDPNQFKFVLQKKADLLIPSLSRWIAQGETEKAKACLSSLTALIKKRAHAKISDRDATVQTNFGCIDGKAVEIDIGSFSALDPLLNPTDEARHIMTPLWLLIAREHPSFLSHFDKILSVN